jgi:hypothetical protein
MSEEIIVQSTIKKQIPNEIIEEENSHEVERLHSFDVDPNKESDNHQAKME